MERRARLITAVTLALSLALTLSLAGCGTGAGKGSHGGNGNPPAGGSSNASGSITLAFAGDVHFERMIRARLDQDPTNALGAMAADTLSKADLAMVNLETAITTRGTRVAKHYNFRAPASAFSALRAAGIDVVTEANNHGLDYGLVGLGDSLAAAKAAEFPVVGIGNDEATAYAPQRFAIKGVHVAVLGATDIIDTPLIPSWTAGPAKAGLASAKRSERLVQAVRDARQGADLVVVYLHWGQEQRNCPTAEQRQLKQLLVTAGADIIVGSHAHVLLGNGWDPSGAFVDYGLGNFVFYKSGIRPSTESGVLLLTVTGRKVSKASWVPARIQQGVPIWQGRPAGKQIITHKKRLRTCTDLLPAPPR